MDSSLRIRPAVVAVGLVVAALLASLTNALAARGPSSAPPRAVAARVHRTAVVEPSDGARSAPRHRDQAAAGPVALHAGWATLLPPHGRPVLVAPPEPSPSVRERQRGGQATFTMLHGMCSHPQPTCNLARIAATELGWFVCPTGNGFCGSAADWAGSGEAKAAFLDESLAKAAEVQPADREPTGGDVLIGFSRGAFVARDVAYSRPGRWVGLVLIGAAMIPDADRLRRNGIRRVVLAAGDFDGARPTMQRAAALLDLAGLPTTFVSLGPIYHTLPADLNERLRPWLRWVREGAPAS